jgi:uncharacterized protein (DUF4415 family)
MPKMLKSRSGRRIILPTPKEDAAITKAAMSDPDAMPLTDAEWKEVRPLLRREAGKTRITIYLDDDVLGKFRVRAEREGRRYQTLINDALREAASPESAPVTVKKLREVLRKELRH